MQTTLDQVVDSFQRNLGIPRNFSKGILEELKGLVSDQAHGEGIEEALDRAIIEAVDKIT